MLNKCICIILNVDLLIAADVITELHKTTAGQLFYYFFSHLLNFNKVCFLLLYLTV